MEGKKFIKLKKEEYGIGEYIKRNLGKGKVSRLNIEYTPLGEKIIISTSKPGLVIGRRGKKIGELTDILKTRFKLKNPHIEINEIKNPLFDAQLVADEIALVLEKLGNLKFKVVAYKKLREIMDAGALGCELRLSGKLPSERAKSWRFAEGYLKKSGESKKEIDRAQSIAYTKKGVIGIKVAVMAPDARIYDKIDINENVRARIKSEVEEVDEEIKVEKTDKKVRKKTKNKKTEKKSKVKKEIKEIKEKEIIKESPDVEPEEDGTAMKIEEEIEEGVPQDVIDKELKEDIEKHEEKVEEQEKGKDKEEIDADKKRKDNKGKDVGKEVGK